MTQSRRDFFLRSASMFALAGSFGAFAPSPAKAWIVAAMAIVQAGLQLYQASRNAGSMPNLNLQLLHEAIANIRLVHLRLDGIEHALAQIMERIEQLPDQLREVLRDEMDALISDQLFAACENVISEVSRLQADFAGVPVDQIPDRSLALLREHYADLQDRRTTLFHRSDLSALAICTAAIVEVSLEKFLGASKQRVRVTVLEYLNKFAAMANANDPKSLLSLHLAASSTATDSAFGDERVFATGLRFPHVFNDWDLRAARWELNAEGLPVHRVREPGLIVRRYVKTFVFYQLTNFVELSPRDYMAQMPIDVVRYYFPGPGVMPGRFTLGVPWPHCSIAPSPGTNNQLSAQILCEIDRVRRDGLDTTTYIRQVDNCGVELELETIPDPYIPDLLYTRIRTARLTVDPHVNAVTRGRLSFQDWTDSDAVQRVEGDGMLSLPGYVVTAPGDYPDQRVRLHSLDARDQEVANYLDYAERDDVLADLEHEIEIDTRGYNERVEYLIMLSSMKSLVEQTAAELRARYLAWEDQ